jgi:thiamine biosynthesis lipoprotein
VTVTAPDSATAEAAAEVGFASADSVERLLSIHRTDSEVSTINREGGRRPVEVSPWTEAIVRTSLEWAERTQGAFDPTIGPVIEVWGFGRSPGGRPDAEALAEAQQLVGWDKVEYDPDAHTVYLPTEGMEFDLRAAAKGFALDRMVEAMQAAGATSGLADFDGDLLMWGMQDSSGKGLWQVDLGDPYDPTRSFARIEVPAGAVSSSASLGRTIVVDGERFGHLIDPRTAMPVRGLASVTVFAEEGLVSDVLSTALFVMGPDEGRMIVESWPGVEALFVLEPEPGGTSPVLATSGMNEYLSGLVGPVRPVVGEDE